VIKTETISKLQLANKMTAYSSKNGKVGQLLEYRFRNTNIIKAILRGRV
jgi:hypothetical protein